MQYLDMFARLYILIDTMLWIASLYYYFKARRKRIDSRRIKHSLFINNRIVYILFSVIVYSNIPIMYLCSLLFRDYTSQYQISIYTSLFTTYLSYVLLMIIFRRNQ